LGLAAVKHNFKLMASIKEVYDEAGNLIQVGDLTFLDEILGKGSYGTVRLARRKRHPTGLSGAAPPNFGDAETTVDGPVTADTGLAQHQDQYASLAKLPDKDRRRRTRGYLTKSQSAPVGDSFFRMTDTERRSCGLSSPLQKAAATISSLLNNSSSFLGSDYDEDEDLVAVKIFSKSLLKRKRHLERNQETRRVQVKTALDQVEREIALMKKLSHPNLVEFYDALDSPESDMLYMVR
jgi:serine/threonine protein kinase